MAWWPRQTPSSGTAPESSRMAGSEMPASAGVQGPGEITIASGARARMPATSRASLRATRTVSPSSSK